MTQFRPGPLNAITDVPGIKAAASFSSFLVLFRAVGLSLIGSRSLQFGSSRGLVRVIAIACPGSGTAISVIGAVLRHSHELDIVNIFEATTL